MSAVSLNGIVADSAVSFVVGDAPSAASLALIDATERALDRLPAWALIAGPVVVLAAMRVVLMPMFEVSHALVDDWYNHAVSLSAFLFGYLTAKSATVKAAFEKARALNAFARVWLPALAARKAALGLLDFDDLVDRACGLLARRDTAAWVLWRLDSSRTQTSRWPVRRR